MANNEILLKTTGLSKNFGGVIALDSIDFHLARGEHVALVGDNGAGKSTFVNILSGALRPDSGRFWLDGSECTFRSPGDAKKAGIETVYQNLAVVDQLDVVANLFLGRERRRFGVGAISLLDHQRMAKEARQLLGRTGVHIPTVKELVRNLSGGQRQGVAIARASGWGSKLIIMDEPTASLGVQETNSVENIITGLRGQGIATIIVSHNLRQVFTLADSVWIMRQGRMVGHLQKSESTTEDVVRLISGADGPSATELSQEFHLNRAQSPHAIQQ